MLPSIFGTPRHEEKGRARKTFKNKSQTYNLGMPFLSTPSRQNPKRMKTVTQAIIPRKQKTLNNSTMNGVSLGIIIVNICIVAFIFILEVPLAVLVFFSILRATRISLLFRQDAVGANAWAVKQGTAIGNGFKGWFWEKDSRFRVFNM